MADTQVWGSSSEAVTPDGFVAAVLAVTARAKAALPEAASRIDTAAALVLAGEVELLEEGLREDRRTGAHHAGRVTWLSEVCRLEGRRAEAGQHARQALALARQLTERGDEALALHQLGAVQASATRPEVAQADASYQQALALAEALGMRPLQAHCHRGLGTLYAAVGQRAQARAELATAIAMYRSMAMTLWLPETEVALVQVDV